MFDKFVSIFPRRTLKGKKKMLEFVDQGYQTFKKRIRYLGIIRYGSNSRDRLCRCNNDNHGNIFFWRTVSVDNKAALCINMYEIIELATPWQSLSPHAIMPFHCRHRKGANRHPKRKEPRRRKNGGETCTYRCRYS